MRTDVTTQSKEKIKVRVLPATFVLAGIGLLVAAGFLLMKDAIKKNVAVSAGRQIPAETLGYQPGVIIIQLKDSVAVKLKKSSAVPIDQIRAGSYDIASESLRQTMTKHRVKEIIPILGEHGKKFKKIRDRLFRLQLDSTTNMMEVAEDLRANNDIASMGPEHLYTVSQEQLPARNTPSLSETSTLYPNDPYLYSSNTWGQGYADLWGLERIGLTPTPNETPTGAGPSGWDIERGSPDTIIAVSDTGVDYLHNDIAANIWTNPGEVPGNAIDDDGNGYVDDANGFDFVHGTYDATGIWTNDADGPMDDHYHGTHVAGTVAAATNNAIGVTGVCWTCRIMPVKGLDSQGRGIETQLIKTIEYAVENGAQVINMSWGGTGLSGALDLVLAEAQAAGVTLVAAAGNDTSDAQGFFPASSPSVITVSALATDNTRSSFSNYGAKIDVAAPGGDHVTSDHDLWRNILSLKTSVAAPSPRDVGTCCRRLAGTSMAAPHVTGVVGLLKSQRPSLDPETIRRILRQSAHDVNSQTRPGWDADLGNGAVNAHDALLLMTPMTSEISSPTSNMAILAGAPLTIRGSTGGPSFVHYEVSVALIGSEMRWELIGQGNDAVTDDVLGTWSVPPQTLGNYIIKLTAFAENGQSLTDTVSVGVGQHPGWPKAVRAPKTPAFGDLDRSRDGLEMIFGSLELKNNRFYLEAWHHDGTPIDGWVYETQTYYVNDKPAVVEIDATNPGLEIISFANPMIRVHNERGQILRDENIGDVPWFAMTAVVADVTPTNPGPEILTGGNDAFNGVGYVNVFDKDLNLLPFHNLRTNEHFRSIPTAANLDADPESEILIGAMDTKVYAWNLDGAPISSNWPIDLSWVVDKAVTVANVDAAGQPEIVVGDGDGYLYVYGPDGRIRSGWPQRMAGFLYADGVAAVDLDLQNPGLEIVSVDSLGNLYALRSNGSPVPGFPVVLPRSDWATATVPIVLQLDPATPEPELLVVQGNTMYGVDSHGRILPEWIISHPEPIIEPVLIDFDADGLKEIVVRGLNNIYVWDTDLSAAVDAPWPEPYLAPTNNSLFERCTYNTTVNTCSAKKPEYCLPIGRVTNSCGSPGFCGCPSGQSCTPSGACQSVCADGTPVNTCSSTLGLYCDSNSQLLNLSTQCASANGVAHTSDDCNFCSGPGQYCSTNGACASASGNYGLHGDYYAGSSFNTLRTENALDPVIDFGPKLGGDDYLETLINQRAANPVAASVRWDGFIYIETTQPITYYVNTSDSTKLYIDNLSTPILTVPFFGGSVQKTFSTGWHPVRIEFQQPFDGMAGLQLGWKVNGAPYAQEHGGMTSPIKLQYIVPHTSLATAIPRPGGLPCGPRFNRPCLLQTE